MAKRLSLFPLGIVVLLFVVELALETRHHLRGLNPPLFSLFSAKAEAKAADVTTFGPTAEFPFASPTVAAAKPDGVRRVWVASASHALAGAAPDRLFPNRLCSLVSQDAMPCQALNGSQFGAAIATNLAHIREHAPNYRPDYIVLYQMSSDINYLVRHLGAGQTTGFGKTLVKNPLFDSAPVSKAIEYTSAYGHLREYVSGTIAMQAPLADDVNAAMLENFRRDVDAFVQLTREVGAEPILTTFAPSHLPANAHEMPYYTKLTLMRYQQALSIKGWLNAVVKFNDVIRDVARTNNVLLIDIEQQLGGKPALFSDFVHLNADGHDALAEALYSGMKPLLKNTVADS